MTLLCGIVRRTSWDIYVIAHGVVLPMSVDHKHPFRVLGIPLEIWIIILRQAIWDYEFPLSLELTSESTGVWKVSAVTGQYSVPVWYCLSGSKVSLLC